MTRRRSPAAGSSPCSTSAVRSVEASSTTITRSTMEGMVPMTEATSFSSLNAGTTTITRRPSNMGGYCKGDMKVAVVPAALAALLCFTPPARAQGVEVLPDVSVHLRAARYLPVERDMHWQGWIGAGAGLLRVEAVTAFIRGDVETIVGNSLRAFEANQANYHLEVGLRRRVGRAT